MTHHSSLPLTAMNMYTLPSKQQQLKYMHQAFFSPPIATLLKAINNNQLQGFPLMKADLINTTAPCTPARKHLPAVMLEGNQYYLVAYAYDPNYMRHPYAIYDESIMTAFDQVFQDLKAKGYKPTFNVTDNQATTPIKAYLGTEDCKWQLSSQTTTRQRSRMPSKPSRTTSSVAYVPPTATGRSNYGTPRQNRSS
eukprot:CCRYP_001204-RA/>CCRYP_001204-RA protein AED:0.46 eAED:0.46 QI:0/0/0/1/1/1/2/0/194